MEDISEESISLSASSEKVVFLAKAALIVMIGTLISRISGFAREMITANYFGAKMHVDAFRAGFILPNLFRVLLADAAIGSAFIPVFASYLTKKGEDDAWEVSNTVTTIAAIGLTAVVALGIIFAPQLISILAPGFIKKPETFALAVKFTRIMFPCILFLALAGLVMGVLHSYDHFTAPSFAPLIFNLIFIGIVVFFSSKLSAVSLALGVTLGGLGQFLFQMPYVRRVTGHRAYSFKLNLSHPGVKQVGLLLAPIVLTLASTDINVIVDMRFASALRTGSVAALGYATRLYLLPMGLFGFAIAAVLFPTLSRQASKGEMRKLKQSFSLGTRVLLFIMIPAGVGLMVFSIPIVRLLFQHGRFMLDDTVMTASALFYYSLSVFMMGELQLVNRCYYALRDSITPMIIAALLIVVNYFGDWAFMIYIPRLAKFLNLPKSVSWLGFAHGGIALSTSIVTTLHVLILLEVLRRRLKGIEGGRITATFVKTSVASLTLGLVAFYTWRGIASFVGQSTLAQLLSLGTAIIIGIATYVGAAFVLKAEEIHLVKELVVERFRKAKND